MLRHFLMAPQAQPYQCSGNRRLGDDPLLNSESRDSWEIYEDRYQVRSTILTSQLPTSKWREQIGGAQKPKN